MELPCVKNVESETSGTRMNYRPGNGRLSYFSLVVRLLGYGCICEPSMRDPFDNLGI